MLRCRQLWRELVVRRRSTCSTPVHVGVVSYDVHVVRLCGRHAAVSAARTSHLVTIHLPTLLLLFMAVTPPE